MAIDVPDGSAPEQPKDASKKVDNDVMSAPSPNKKKGLIIVATLGLLAVAGLLIGLVPDWGSKEEVDPVPEDDGMTNETAKQQYFESNSGPFQIKVSLFSPDITHGYDSTEELGNDLEQLAMFLLNEAIISQSTWNQRGPDAGGEDVDMVAAPGAPSGGDAADEGSMMAESAPTGGLGEGLANENHFETNNQEESVDRSDLTKSDGNLIFVAYGDYLIALTAATGQEVSRVQMPPIELPPGFGQANGGGDERPPGEMFDEPMVPFEPGMSSMPSFWNPKPNIDALLLEGDRIAVVASGYGIEHTVWGGPEDDMPSVLWDFQNTKVHLYDVNGGDLLYVASKTCNGSFRDAFSMDDGSGSGFGYVVTQSGINTWDYLLAPIQRWQTRFAGLSDEQYLEMATRVAQEAIPDFVAALHEAIHANGPVDLARLSMYANSVSEDGSLEMSIFAGGIANAVTHVISFSMDGTFDDGNDIAVHTAATFQPGYWTHVYAHEQMIIVADQGWTWNEEEETSAEMTYLLGFRLQGPSSTHAVVGAVPGHVLSPYSLDFVSEGGFDYLRVATTQNFWFQERFIAVDAVGIAAEGPASSGSATAAEAEESSTLNQIVVLKFPANPDSEDNELTFIKAVELGKPNERFTAVRFFDKVAYAVTFERIDPFYVIDFEDPENPEVVGELEVPGFSEYLHSVNADNTLLAAVGQLTDENTGFPIGMQISLFDAQNPAATALIARLPITEDSENSWSSSPVSWDPRAFRYLYLDDGVGYMIIPLTTSTYYIDELIEVGEGDAAQPGIPEHFDGFAVFAIDVSLPEDEMIARVLDIDHTDMSNFQDGYWYCGWLPERSFVISGHLITMKAHSIISTYLVTAAETWSLGVDELGGCSVYRH